MVMKNHKIAILFAVLLSLCTYYIYCDDEGLVAKTAQGGDRMIGVYSAEEFVKMRKDQTPQQIVSFLKKQGVNAVFGGAKNAAFRDECKKQGIKVFVDILCFQGENFWKEHPESRPIGADGKPIEKVNWYCGVCPNQQWLREKILDDVKQHVTEYDVDGVWLDFIRYSCHWEVKEPKIFQSCFCDVCTGLFGQHKGLKLPLEDKATTAKFILDHYQDDWTQWKCERIAEFVAEVVKTVKDANPEIPVGLFVVPWRLEERDGAIRKIIAQDYELLAKSGVDIFSPMVYHRMCYRDVDWIAETTKDLKSRTGKQIIPIIQACSLPDELTNDEFTQAMRAALSPESSGVIVFGATYLESEKKWDSFKKAIGARGE